MFEDFEDFKPEYFLDFSKEIYEKSDLLNSNNSTLKRVIYGRIYYAVFLFVREWLKDNKNYNSTHKDHTTMLNFIRKYGPFDSCENNLIADHIYVLKKLRQQADYYIVMPNKNDKNHSNWISMSIEESFEMAHYIIDAFIQLK